MPADLAVRGGFNGKHALGTNSTTLVKPLPDHPLGNPDLLAKFGLTDFVPLEVGRELHAPILASLVRNVNSKLLDTRKPAVHRSGMPTRSRPKPGAGVPKEVMAEEGKTLRQLWKARAKRTQEKFAAEMGFSQGNFSHYIGGRRPIPLDIGKSIARELGIALSDFSPRLASEDMEQPTTAVVWPFASLSVERFLALSPGQRLQVEGRLLEALEQLELASKTPRKTG